MWETNIILVSGPSSWGSRLRGLGAGQDWGSGQRSEGWVEIIYREVMTSVTPRGRCLDKKQEQSGLPMGSWGHRFPEVSELAGERRAQALVSVLACGSIGHLALDVYKFLAGPLWTVALSPAPGGFACLHFQKGKLRHRRALAIGGRSRAGQGQGREHGGPPLLGRGTSGPCGP